MSSVDDDLHRRLENWARWHSGGIGSRSEGTSSLYGFVSSGRHYSDTEIPVINSEAMQTDTAIRKLDDELQGALRARYLREAKDGLSGEPYTMYTMSEIEVAAALYISYDTYLRRLKQARRALLEQLRNARSDAGLKIQA